ncbi:8-amino-7-oxononanoate synthase [Sulfuricella denitrificans skB26]|uniref:8-amino-7-oxononanoate synthase n=1 Tax=Sulfuricella denitrificans (strain DSM 22764 / NBRC 105220 / skB26) TaxID=1163617 RepID=S6AB18_SULDS|nr:8-amino-7-oxononanoate synthase [Sulfuricella denitrificans]BAN36465.1 8-amino-7-oxononanoate synthase [Sulfuricella denitrificans skB26]
MLFPSLADELKDLEAAGLRRHRRVLESPQGARIVVDGREYLSFCSNDYLGLANHPALIAAAQSAAARYGVGVGASHLVNGHSVLHHELEVALAAFTGLPSALFFSTGYMANLGIVTALAGRDDEIFADKLNHASLNDAALLSRARFTRYPHLDLVVLEKRLAASRSKRKLVVTDAVFSMDGDIAPVPELLALCERHDALLVLDDAHGFGVLGDKGRGVLEHFGLLSRCLPPHSSPLTPHLIYMATLGKAAGVFGAFVAGPVELTDYLVQRARSYIYTTATPPLLSAALAASLKLIDEETWRRERLRELIASLRQSLKLQRWRLMDSTTPIQPVIIGSNQEALAVSEVLRERGIWVPAIRPPTVPKGEARLRISLSAAHTIEDVAHLAAALNELESAA